jgi:hypothetical protein
MSFDVGDLLGSLFGVGPTVATVAAVPRNKLVPLVVDGRQDDGDGGRFADWVRRPDCHGRMGWETPDLPEAERWWARCDFDDLPEVPEGFSMGELPKPAPPLPRRGVSGGMVDTLDLGDNRPLQGQLRGFAGV